MKTLYQKEERLLVKSSKPTSKQKHIIIKLKDILSLNLMLGNSDNCDTVSLESYEELSCSTHKENKFKPLHTTGTHIIN